MKNLEETLMEEGLHKFADPAEGAAEADRREAVGVDRRRSALSGKASGAALARRWETTGGLTPRRSHA